MKNNKYQITDIKGRLLRLGFVTCYLLIVLLSACEDGYKPNIRDIRFYQNEIKKRNLISTDNPLKVNDTGTTLIIICTIPSGVKELSIKVQFPAELEVTPYFAYEDDAYVINWDKNGNIEVGPIAADTPLELKVTAKPGFDKGNITVTIGTGGDADASGVCAVEAGTPSSGDIAVAFNNLSANGGTTTTSLTLTFNQAIPGLSAGDISFSGVDGVTGGTLGGSGPSYTLPINGFTTGGSLTVTVSKTGYNIYPPSKQVTIYYYDAPSDDLVTEKAITGLTPPVTGATPVTAITNTTQYTGSVTWSDTPTTFAGETVYTATITLTVKSGYTLTGLASDFFTVAGSTSVSFTSPNTVTVVFPATASSNPGVTITITFTVTDGALTATPSPAGTVTYAGLKGGTQTVALTFSNGPYTDMVWDMDGEVLSGVTSNTLTINSGFSKLDKLVSGIHVINVSGTRDGQRYSGTVQITIAMVP